MLKYEQQENKILTNALVIFKYRDSQLKNHERKIGMEKKTKLIFNRKIALELSKRGYPIVNIIENYNKKYIEIYVFNYTEKFNRAFTDIVKSRA